jgi:integrase/recombinase XerD
MPRVAGMISSSQARHVRRRVDGAAVPVIPVRLPSGTRYWTVIDAAAYRPVAEADDFLLHVRLGRDGAESTIHAYATSIGLLLTWCVRVGLDRAESGAHLGRLMHWLGHYDPDS